MKTIAMILTSFLMSNAHAAGPEIWWAIRVNCNQFMRNLQIDLQEVGGNAVENSYAGDGVHNYETLSFPKCVNDDDSITCTGTSNITKQSLKLVITRNQDGTFKGNLNGQILGCLLSR